MIQADLGGHYLAQPGPAAAHQGRKAESPAALDLVAPAEGAVGAIAGWAVAGTAVAADGHVEIETEKVESVENPQWKAASLAGGVAGYREVHCKAALVAGGAAAAAAVTEMPVIPRETHSTELEVQIAAALDEED